MVAKMTTEQANELLDSIKDGNTYASIRAITQALFQTGDIPNNPKAFDLDGIAEGRKTLRMGQGKET
jgi:hypothetical protein